MAGSVERLGAGHASELKHRFCEALTLTANVTDAANAIGKGRSTLYLWREHDAEFARQWDEALAARTDKVLRMAMKRVDEGSDVMIKFLLAAWDPDTYAERSRLDVTSGGAPLHVSDAELAMRVLQLLTVAQQAPPPAHRTETIVDADWHEIDGCEDLV